MRSNIPHLFNLLLVVRHQPRHDLLDMLITRLSDSVYVRIRKNHVTVRHPRSRRDVALEAVKPFTTTRLLVGDLRAAHETFLAALRSTVPTSWFRPSPVVVVHPLEMTEGGLSEVEERILKEVFLGLGAAKAVVWVGPELTDAEVEAKAFEKSAV